jgi:serralysin
VPAANGQTTRITDFDPAEDRIDLSAFPMLRDFGQIGLTPTASGARLVWRETILEVTTPLRRPLREADFGLDPLGGATPLPIAEPARPAGLRRDGSTGPDRLTGGSGDDLLIGGAGHDTLAGEDGNDSLVGAEGNDRLDGGRGSDTLEGGPGNDRYVIDSAGDVIADEVGFSQGGGIDTVEAWVSHTLPRNVEILRLQGDANLTGTGNAAPEALVGNRGGNRLDGAGGNDVLNGKDGNDTLIGGLGADTLVGEAGRDVFVFRSVAESRPGLTGRDFINGFQVGIDRIDLSAIDANPVLAGDQAFVFIGTAAFSGQPGQLRHFTFGPGGFCIVEADVNGDRVADMQIFVNQTGFVLAGDFLL